MYLDELTGLLGECVVEGPVLLVAVVVGEVAGDDVVAVAGQFELAGAGERVGSFVGEGSVPGVVHGGGSVTVGGFDGDGDRAGVVTG